MGKRIITKIGDIFCVETGNYKRFFQYIANDKTQLNSSVVRVFSKQFPLNFTPIPNDIVHDDISFYSHIIIKAGIVNKVWYKVGNSSNIGETDRIMFRLSDIGTPKWYIWKINGSFQDIINLTDEIKKYDLGAVFSFSSFVEKIRTGHYKNEQSFTWE